MLDDVPSSVRERAKYLLLDGVACALVGAPLPVSRKGVAAATALDGAGSGALIGWGHRTTSPQSAAMRNSSLIHGFALDDYRPLAPLHSNSLVLPAMLAAAPYTGRVSGRFPLRRPSATRASSTARCSVFRTPGLTYSMTYCWWRLTHPARVSWGYYNFNHHEPKAPTAKLRPKSECAFCDQASAKKDEVWTQFYRLLDN